MSKARFTLAGVKVTEAQLVLAQHLKELGITVEPEFPFDEARNWRFDLVASGGETLAFECDGGQWSGGHRRGKAIDAENEKLNSATLSGWRVLRFTNDYILSGQAKACLARYLR